MPNIEIKAKCSDIKKARLIADQLKTDYVGNLHQIDTYFETRTGRLKLREINGESAELIPYKKDYSTGPMKSDYAVLPVDNSVNTKSILEKILGIVTVVDKKREVFLIDNVRVHLDRVKDLGDFVECEAVYDGGEEQEALEKIRVSELMRKFEIKEDDLLYQSYIDYLLVNKS